MQKGILLFLSSKPLFKGGDVLNLDKLKGELVSLKCELVARAKTINWKHPVILVFVALIALELIATVASARWGARWGGYGGWGRWGGWGAGSWGGWGRPWYSGWAGWW